MDRGGNWYGQLGNGVTSNDREPSPVPITIDASVPVVALALSESSTFAVISDSTFQRWGNAGQGPV